jgi:hypothetical protein
MGDGPTVGHVPDLDGAVGAGGDEAGACLVEGQRVDDPAVTEPGIAEDAGDMVGQAGRQSRQAPASAAEAVAGFDQPAGEQGRLALFGEAGGTIEPLGGKLLAEVFLGGPVLGLVARLQSLDHLRGQACGLFWRVLVRRRGPSWGECQ